MENKMTDSVNSVGLAPQRRNPTVKEFFDDVIERSRKNTEELCIKKAKLETIGLLNMPYYEVSDLLQTYPF